MAYSEVPLFESAETIESPQKTPGENQRVAALQSGRFHMNAGVAFNLPQNVVQRVIKSEGRLEQARDGQQFSFDTTQPAGPCGRTTARTRQLGSPPVITDPTGVSNIEPRRMAADGALGVVIGLIGGAAGLVLGTLRLPILLNVLRMDYRRVAITVF